MQHRIPQDMEQAQFPESGRMCRTPNGYLYGWGTTVGNGVEDWAPGALFIKTDGSSAQNVTYRNVGTKTTAQFEQIEDSRLITVPIDANSVDTWVAIADRDLQFVSAWEVHTVAGNDGGAVTAAWVKSGDVEAPSAGDAIHTSTFNLKGTANTVQLLTTAGAGASITSGDKIGINFSGTLTNLAGGCMVLHLRHN